MATSSFDDATWKHSKRQKAGLEIMTGLFHTSLFPAETGSCDMLSPCYQSRWPKVTSQLGERHINSFIRVWMRLKVNWRRSVSSGRSAHWWCLCMRGTGPWCVTETDVCALREHTVVSTCFHWWNLTCYIKQKNPCELKSMCVLVHVCVRADVQECAECYQIKLVKHPTPPVTKCVFSVSTSHR